MFLFVLTVVVIFGIVSTGFGAKILFMQSTANLDFDDQMGEFFESLGHEVEFFDTAGTIDIDQIEAAEEVDLVYIAESLGSDTTHDGVETFIKEVETPQIWAEAFSLPSEIQSCSLPGSFVTWCLELHTIVPIPSGRRHGRFSRHCPSRH